MMVNGKTGYTTRKSNGIIIIQHIHLLCVVVMVTEKTADDCALRQHVVHESVHVVNVPGPTAVFQDAG